MGRQILAVVAGMFGAFLTIMIFEKLGAFIYEPAAFDPQDPEEVKNMMNNMPVKAFIVILIAHLLGAFSGGIISKAISNPRNQIIPIITGLLALGGGIINIALIPHPTWFVVADLLIYLPAAYIGGMLISKRKQS